MSKKETIVKRSNSFLEAIDIFDKFDNDDLTFKTRSGAFISICLSIFAGIYLTIKVVRFCTPKIYRDLALNAALVDQEDFINISVAVTVDIPCYFLHFDHIDTLGVSQLDINSTTNMRRLTKSGKLIGVANETLKDVCYPCFGALPDNVCCNSCEQLILLHMWKGLEAKPDEWPQCKSKKAAPKVSADEKCRIKGKVSVNKIDGGFHIAPGRNDVSGGGHHHDLGFNFPNIDLSHTIEHIRFGPKIPTANNPLKGLRVKQDPNVAMRYNYILLATPVVYVKDGNEKARGYEYTAMVTSHPIMRGEAPGIFFQYTLTPYTVTVNAKSRSLAQFITSTFGFLSGCFGAAQMLDMFIDKTGLLNFFQKKQESK